MWVRVPPVSPFIMTAHLINIISLVAFISYFILALTPYKRQEDEPRLNKQERE